MHVVDIWDGHPPQPNGQKNAGKDQLSGSATNAGRNSHEMPGRRLPFAVEAKDGHLSRLCIETKTTFGSSSQSARYDR